MPRFLPESRIASPHNVADHRPFASDDAACKQSGWIGRLGGNAIDELHILGANLRALDLKIMKARVHIRV